jgi:coenzyme PQQ biosynthesis protein PqqD
VAIRKSSVYAPSDDVVAREIEGEVIIVPLAAGIGNMEGELYTLNEIARAIWNRLDGKRNLDEVITALVQDYDAPRDEIEGDVLGFVEELVGRRMLIEITAL